MLTRRESLEKADDEFASHLIRVRARDQMRIATFSSQEDEAVVGENWND